MRLQKSLFVQTAADSDGYAQSGTNFDGYVVSASQNSAPAYVGNILGYCVVFTCPATGAPNGTIKLQGSVDNSLKFDEKPDSKVTNWFDLSVVNPVTGLTVTTQTISGASTLAFEETSCFYRWVRAVIVNTSGTMTATIKLQVKGIQ